MLAHPIRVRGAVRALILVVTFGLLPATEHATAAVSWQPISVSGPLPPTRRDAAMAYDRPRHRLVLFGGRQGSTPLNDTWIFDLDAGSWRQVATGAAPRPSPRLSMISGIDAFAGRFVIATGQGQGGVFFNDTWAFNLETESWIQLPTTGASPAIRYGSGGGIFDVGGFGSFGTKLFLSHGFTNSGRFNDTRALDLDGGSWEDLTPASILPLRRCLHGASPVSYDRFVMFGGCASGFGPCPLDDTWLFDATTRQWTDLSQATRPPAREFPSLVTLGEDGDVLLFGGIGASLFNDVWKLSRASWSWALQSPAGPAPSARQGSSAVWVDPADPALTGAGCGRVFVFGGRDASTDRNDLWALVPATTPAAAMIGAEKVGDDVRFEWLADPSVGGYQVWRSDEPGFSNAVRLPGDVSVTGSTASYVDTSSGNPVSVSFYRVRFGRCTGF